MHSLLNQLQTDESILMMYAAGELSAEDRGHVEQRLANDAALRAELDRVRELTGTVDDALERIDASTRLPVSEGVAVRKVGRVMRQWQIDRMAPPPVEEPQDQLRFPWWTYPLATAAAVLLAFLVWWGQQDGPPQRRIAHGVSESSAEVDQRMMWDWDSEMARHLRRSLWSGYEPNGLQLDVDAMASADPSIDDVEGIFMSPVENERTQ